MARKTAPSCSFTMCSFYPRKMGLVDKAKQSMRKKCEGLRGGDAHYDCMIEETNILLNT